MAGGLSFQQPSSVSRQGNIPYPSRARHVLAKYWKCMTMVIKDYEGYASLQLLHNGKAIKSQAYRLTHTMGFFQFSFYQIQSHDFHWFRAIEEDTRPR